MAPGTTKERTVRKFQTMTWAIDPKDGKLKKWIGPRIEAISRKDAEEKIKGFGYLQVTGELRSEVDEESGKEKELHNWN
ncbi:hypothetical protein J0X14_14310 [Muricauda sp. CAU 1633]|uniref:hypothetical protein n=1 Tax=Allomuricauda sp. CAU 1633 TaxID=2816036 RepID=UPI001A8CBC5C|nr:hypothetical protein [Muricauda sp. CAU 1633]MBO0323478.1 hypothetical protein [Muricauda sp. CAU 1633]